MADGGLAIELFSGKKMITHELEINERAYSIEEIAEDLDVSLKLIRRYVASGQLAAAQRGS